MRTSSGAEVSDFEVERACRLIAKAENPRKHITSEMLEDVRGRIAVIWELPAADRAAIIRVLRMRPKDKVEACGLEFKQPTSRMTAAELCDLKVAAQKKIAAESSKDRRYRLRKLYFEVYGEPAPMFHRAVAS